MSSLKLNDPSDYKTKNAVSVAPYLAPSKTYQLETHGGSQSD